MHETSLTDYALNAVETKAAQMGIREVRVVGLVVGKAKAVPLLMEKAFQIIRMKHPMCREASLHLDVREIRIAGLKLIGDGSISGKTAWLREPYLGTEECGMPVYSDESLEKAIDFAKKAGCQISVHAIGGQAIDRIRVEETFIRGERVYQR